MIRFVIGQHFASKMEPAFPPLVEALLDEWGVQMESIAAGIYRLTPDHRYARALPGFRPSGLTVTTDRDIALVREEIDFLTWDHPLVIGAKDLFLGSERGNVAFVHLKTSVQPLLLLEMVFVLETAGPPALVLERFLPPLTLRMVVDEDLKAAAERLPDPNAESFRDGSERLRSRLLAASSRRIPAMVDAGRSLVRNRARTIIQAAQQSARRSLDGNVSHLESLHHARAVVDDRAIRVARQEREHILAAISGARLRLDAIRLVAAGDLAGSPLSGPAQTALDRRSTSR